MTNCPVVGCEFMSARLDVRLAVHFEQVHGWPVSAAAGFVAWMIFARAVVGRRSGA